jgi:hypothetical protein
VADREAASLCRNLSCNKSQALAKEDKCTLVFFPDEPWRDYGEVIVKTKIQ